MVTIRVEIETKGAIFEGKAGPIIERGVRDAVQQLVEMGEQRLDLMLRTRPAGVYLSISEAKKGQASQGNYARNINATAKDLNGLITDGGVLYGPWLEGTSSRNATTRFKGYASFRRVGESLQKDAPSILERHIDKAVQEMNA